MSQNWILENGARLTEIKEFHKFDSKARIETGQFGSSQPLVGTEFEMFQISCDTELNNPDSTYALQFEDFSYRIDLIEEIASFGDSYTYNVRTNHKQPTG